MGDQGLKAVGQFCKQLEELNLRFCEGVSDDGIVGIAKGCGKSLKSLGIGACARVTDLALQVSYASIQYFELFSSFISLCLS